MFKKLEEFGAYLINDYNTSGFKIRILARTHMLDAICTLLLHTYWLFGLPKNWDPSLKGQGPYDPPQFRIFCFFVYNVSLFINCGHFFNGLLLYNCVDQGIKEKDGTLETTKYWIIFSFVLFVINILKFVMLYVHLQYPVQFALIMTVPEEIIHIVGVFVMILFRYELRKMPIIEDIRTYTIGKNGKIIFNP